MNRRDLLKLIGIGGVGAVATVVGGKEAEAAPVVEAVEPSVLRNAVGDVVYNLPSGTVSYWYGSASFYPIGSASFWELDVDPAELFDFGGGE